MKLAEITIMHRAGHWFHHKTTAGALAGYRSASFKKKHTSSDPTEAKLFSVYSR